MSVYIVAELGSNHDQQLDRAINLIYRAKEAGADAAKFQLYRADSLVKKRNAEAYRHIYKGTEMPDSWLPLLKEACDTMGIDFMCTAYDEWGVDAVAPFVDLFKVASFELNDHNLLAYIRKYCEGKYCEGESGQKVVLSTGMGTIKEVGKAASLLGINNIAYALHCTSTYPCPIGDVNLNVLPNFLNAIRWNLPITHPSVLQLPFLIGFSDHTTGISAPVAAVTLGAKCIEKHMTDDRARVGPDHHFALEPSEFKQMVMMIREVEMALGEGRKEPQESEAEMMRYRVGSEERG